MEASKASSACSNRSSVFSSMRTNISEAASSGSAGRPKSPKVWAVIIWKAPISSGIA